MAISVQFSIEGKKWNSTKVVPTPVTYECDLKYPTSVEAPTILVHIAPGSASPYLYSCARIMQWNRSYFVSDCRAISATQWEFDLVVDVLASYKQDIMKSSAFIVRSSANYNTDLIDSMLPTTVSNISETKQDIISLFDGADGAYILTTIGGSSGAGVGAVAQYVLPPATASQLTNAISSEGVLEEVRRYFSNPYDSIVSVIWQPMSQSSGGYEIKLGQYPTGVSGGKPAVVKYDTTFQAELPFSDYRRHSQIDITLNLPGAGELKIDPTILVYREKAQEGGLLPPIPKGFSIRVEATYDQATGDIHYKLTEPNKQSLIALVDGNVSVQVMSGMRASSVGQAITALSMGFGAAVGIAGMMAGSPTVAGGVSSYATRAAMSIAGSSVGMITNGAVQLNRQSMYGTGHTGGRAGVDDNKKIYLTIRYRTISQEPESAAPVIGLPVYRNEPLASFDGQYVVCTYWVFDIACTASERAQLEALMNGTSGVYLE